MEKTDLLLQLTCLDLAKKSLTKPEEGLASPAGQKKSTAGPRPGYLILGKELNLLWLDKLSQPYQAEAAGLAWLLVLV